LARIHLEIVRMWPMIAQQIKFMMPRWNIIEVIRYVVPCAQTP
jgi:hypothetical protein